MSNTVSAEKLRRDSGKVIKWLEQSTQTPSEGEAGTGTWVERSGPWVNWETSFYSKPLCICGPPG